MDNTTGANTILQKRQSRAPRKLRSFLVDWTPTTNFMMSKALANRGSNSGQRLKRGRKRANSPQMYEDNSSNRHTNKKSKEENQTLVDRNLSNNIDSLRQNMEHG